MSPQLVLWIISPKPQAMRQDETSGRSWDSKVNMKTLKCLFQNLCGCLNENLSSPFGPNPSPHMPDLPFTHPSDTIVRLPEHRHPTGLGHHSKGKAHSVGHHFGSLSLPPSHWGRFWTTMVFKPKFYRFTKALSYLYLLVLVSLLQFLNSFSLGAQIIPEKGLKIN